MTVLGIFRLFHVWHWHWDYAVWILAAHKVEPGEEVSVEQIRETANQRILNVENLMGRIFQVIHGS